MQPRPFISRLFHYPACVCEREGEYVCLGVLGCVCVRVCLFVRAHMQQLPFISRHFIASRVCAQEKVRVCVCVCVYLRVCLSVFVCVHAALALHFVLHLKRDLYSPKEPYTPSKEPSSLCVCACSSSPSFRAASPAAYWVGVRRGKGEGGKEGGGGDRKRVAKMSRLLKFVVFFGPLSPFLSNTHTNTHTHKHTNILSPPPPPTPGPT